MKPKYYPVPSKAQRELRRYEDRWLPPFSAGSLLGMTLFFLFIGSALRSILIPPDIAGLDAAYKERMEERTFCCSFQNQFLPTTPWKPACTDILFKNSRDKLSTKSSNDVNNDTFTSTRRKKYIFMQPQGSLGSRLRAVASALSLAAEVGAEPVIVWRNTEFGYTGAWNDLFRAPELPLGCFPGEALRQETALCKVYTVNSRADWLDIKNKWETKGITTTNKTGAGNNSATNTTTNSEIDVLCLKSTAVYLTLPKKERELKGFYQLLQPAEPIQKQIDTFMSTVQWNDSATTWVGVHFRRTDLKLRCTSENCREGVNVQEGLPFIEFTRLMNLVAQLAPKNTRIRFYLATDDSQAEEEMKRQLTHEMETRAALLLQRNTDNAMGLVGGNEKGAITRSGTSFKSAPLVDVPSQTAILKTMAGTSTAAAAAGELSEMLSVPPVVSMPKATRDAPRRSSVGWLETRGVEEVSGLQETVADLYMLSRAQILIGTAGSTFSQTAKLMGDAFFLTAGAELELKT